MFRRGPGRLEMCFYAYKNVLEPMGHLGANLIFSILTLNQVMQEENRHARREARKLGIGSALPPYPRPERAEVDLRLRVTPPSAGLWSQDREPRVSRPLRRCDTLYK